MLILWVTAVFMQSCYRSPVACFSISVNTDSIYVNKPVTFDGTCSYLAKEYFWQFETKKDTLGSFNAVDTETFTDTGNVIVVLSVLNGNQVSSVSQTIHVRP